MCLTLFFLDQSVTGNSGAQFVTGDSGWLTMHVAPHIFTVTGDGIFHNEFDSSTHCFL
jgi:hypothetical protein